MDESVPRSVEFLLGRIEGKVDATHEAVGATNKAFTAHVAAEAKWQKGMEREVAKHNQWFFAVVAVFAVLTFIAAGGWIRLWPVLNAGAPRAALEVQAMPAAQARPVESH